MKIESLGRTTDVFICEFSGEVTNFEDYLVVKTPKNPEYYWGNFILFKQAPVAGDVKRWKKLFDKHFPLYNPPQHYSFAWDQQAFEPEVIKEFESQDFEFEETVVLASAKLREPKHPRSDLDIRPLQSDADWAQALENQILCVEAKYMNEHYRLFKSNQMKNYRRLSERGYGHWFGAFKQGKLLGDLGIFFKGNLGRFQSVGTHPDARGKGVCGNLVYQAGMYALQKFGVTTLVMEADPGYHAARIYQSLGFKDCETIYSLSWWRDKE